MLPRALTAGEILRAWEVGSTLHALDRAMVLCAFAAPDVDRQSLTALSLGDRDALLLALRQGTFGDRIEAVAECDRCSALLEFSITADMLKVETPAGEARVSTGDRELRLRRLDSRDLAAVAGVADPALARQMLIERSVVGTVGPLSAAEQALVAARLGELDPQADLVFDLTCSECQHRFPVPLDLSAFLWSEIAIEARRLMQEVAALASAFKWSERDILSMGRKRRQLYLELAEA